MLNQLGTENILSSEEYRRYARQIIIQNLGAQGQKRLKQARIIFIGAGGLNAPSLIYLVACGIGTIGIIDYDTVEISNLQRQILYEYDDINKYKIKAASKKLKSLNPLINIQTYKQSLNKNNITKILYYYDIVIDGTDNIEIRFLISKYSHLLHKVHIYGAIDTFTGHISVFNYKNSTNYYKVYERMSDKKIKACSETGIINTVAGIIGLLQATEAIKIIAGIGSIPNNSLLIFNLLNSSLNKRKISLSKINTGKLEKTEASNNINHKKYLQITDIYNHINKKYKLIDIRRPTEFKIDHLKYAINIPLNKLKRQKYIQYLKKLSEYSIIIYCNNETRSYIGSQILANYNIEHYILKNGIDKK